MRYLPLNVRSAFTFLYGSFHPEDLVDAVADRGGAGVACADAAGLYGMVRLAKAGRRRGLYTLCGAYLPLAGGGGILCYPRSAEGQAELCAVITRAHAESPRGAPLVEPSWLSPARGIVAVLPGREVLDLGVFWLAQIKGLFSGPLFLGLPGAEVGPAQRGVLRQVARQAGLTAVAAPEIVALDRQGYSAHQSLVAIAQAIHHRPISPLPPGSGVLARDEDLAGLFTPAEMLATWRVGDLCTWQLPLKKRHLPDYPLPEGRTPERELSRRCLKSLARRRSLDKVYASRLQRELGHIERFGFAPYFLLVSDIMDFARAKGIRASVRGSAAGSLVTWLLCGGVDPIEHDLLFERFLNDGRREAPDVDIDFDSLRRDEVLRYVMGRFPGRSAMVATVPTFRARSAVRELFISQGGRPDEASEFTALIPHYTRPARLKHLLEITPELAGHPLAGRPGLLRDAALISGLPRQLSVHLGGVALGPLDRLAPVEISAQGLPVVQLGKDDVEELGFIKLDILGLRMHSAIAGSLGFLRARGVEVEPDKLPLDDPAVYGLICTTDTVGIFQVESPGQRGLLGRMQPRNFLDLMIEISLFRPGPMRADMVTPFVERHAGRQEALYPHPCLEPILGETLGVVVFQEQVLKVAHFLAGLTYGQADGLRRAMTHRRSKAEMDAMRGDFVANCLSNGVGEGTAGLMWDQVSCFAAYGFAKAHAACFAHITYVSAWLRTHHPLEFFLGLLNAGHVGGYPPRVLLNEARRVGIPCLGPCVNRSGVWYRPENGAIRVGLIVIRGMGPKGTAKVVDARQEGGFFRNEADLAVRSGLNQAQMLALKQAGALQGLRRAAA